MRVELCRNALALNLGWHGEHSVGEVIDRVDADIDAITRSTSTAVLHVIGNAAVLAAVSATALVVEWRAGLVLLATVAVVVVLGRMRSVAVPQPRPRARGRRPPLRRPRGAPGRA